MLSEYLNYMNQPHKGQLIRKEKHVAMMIKWGDSKNINDT